MKLNRSINVMMVSIVSVLALMALWVVALPATAQSAPSINSPGQVITLTLAAGDGPTAQSDKLIAPIADNGPDARPAKTSAPAVTFSYYRLLGTALNPRTSATTFAYNFNGCIYETGGTDNRFMAPLLIPDGSIIKFLRLYYDDTSAGTDLTAWITRYQPGQTSQDLTSVSSSGSSGFGSMLSPEITHTVDLANWAYTIIVAPNGNAVSNTICGIRVAYYAPSIFGVALPLIFKQ